MRRTFALALLFFCLFSMSVYGHSGGTDSQGGHHDYNNVSGLGDYHFHEGHGPHLHPNGVCPFDTAEENTPDYASSSYSQSDYSDGVAVDVSRHNENEWWEFWELQTEGQFATGVLVLALAWFVISRVIRGINK